MGFTGTGAALLVFSLDPCLISLPCCSTYLVRCDLTKSRQWLGLDGRYERWWVGVVVGWYCGDYFPGVYVLAFLAYLHVVSLTGWSPWGSCMCGGVGFCSPVFRLSLVGCCVLRVLVSLAWVVLLAGWLLALGRGGAWGGKNCVLPVEGCWVPGG